MNNGKQVKTPRIEIYRFSHWYSNGCSADTSEKGILLEMDGPNPRAAYIQADFLRGNVLAPPSQEFAERLTETIYRWLKDSLVDNKKNEPIEIRCDREKENGDNYGLTFRQYKRLSPTERERIEAALKDCRKRGKPEVRLVAQKNGEKKS